MIDLNHFVAHIGWANNRSAKLARPIVTRILQRPFSQSEIIRRRIVLIYMDESLAYPMFAGFLRKTEIMKNAGIEFRGISYSQYIKSPTFLDAHAIFIQGPYFIDRTVLGSQVEELRHKNPNAVISFFEWSAPCDLRFAEYVEPWIDFYVKKSLPRDYLKNFELILGHSEIADYYSEMFGTQNPIRDWNFCEAIGPKLMLAPAFHFSSSLFKYFSNQAPLNSRNRFIDLHARFNATGEGWYAAMRSYSKSLVDGLNERMNVVSTGNVNHNQFMKELSNSKICFSPFGYGEICWRDYEAVAAGAVLLKPDMSHVLTDPDIYRPFETYIPIRWDMSDLNEKIQMLLSDNELRNRIARNAFSVVKSNLVDQSMAHLAKKLSGLNLE